MTTQHEGKMNQLSLLEKEFNLLAADADAYYKRQEHLLADLKRRVREGEISDDELTKALEQSKQDGIAWQAEYQQRTSAFDKKFAALGV